MTVNWDVVEARLKESWTNDFWGQPAGKRVDCAWTATWLNVPNSEMTEDHKYYLLNLYLTEIFGGRAGGMNSTNLFSWNDTPERTLDEVLAVVRKVREKYVWVPAGVAGLTSPLEGSQSTDVS